MTIKAMVIKTDDHQTMTTDSRCCHSLQEQVVNLISTAIVPKKMRMIEWGKNSEEY